MVDCLVDFQSTLYIARAVFHQYVLGCECPIDESGEVQALHTDWMILNSFPDPHCDSMRLQTVLGPRDSRRWKTATVVVSEFKRIRVHGS